MIYKPVGIPCQDLPESFIELDEFEAMRLCDLEGLEQTEAGERMGVSRGTVQRLLNGGRRKLIEGILTSSAIRIKNELKRDESSRNGNKARMNEKPGSLGLRESQTPNKDT